MSQRRPPPKTPPPPPSEEDEEEIDEDMDEFDEDGMDMFEALGGLLATEDGETVATLLAGLKDSVEGVARQLEVHNKIMVKILTEMKGSKVCSCAPAPEPQHITAPA
jgi:hypothetical protein